MWRWQHVDFPTIARDAHLDEKLVRKKYEVVFRYAPRGNNEDDPFAFQIVTMHPTWLSTDERNHADEDHTLVRCCAISDKTGQPPSKLFIGGTYKDRYFRATAWRLPPGSFGMGKKRPVLLYIGMSLEKLSLGEISMLDPEINRSGTWQNDDEWEERDDGWDPVEAAQKKADEAAAAAAAEQEKIDKAKKASGDTD
jgi:hypothetical protein